MKKLSLLIMGASLILAPFFYAVAAVPVVESESTAEIALRAEIEKTNSANAELLGQVQTLQDALMQTRGNIEELQHEIQVLKQKRLDDYINIDKRLTELSKATITQPIATENTPIDPSIAAIVNTDPSLVPNPSVAPVISAEVQVPNSGASQDSVEYQKTYELVRLRKFEDAKIGFNRFLTKYPSSEFLPNVYFWLGELYIIDGNFLEAKKSFQIVLKNYSSHPKYPDALYKVATVNYELGDRMTAKQQLEELTKFKDQSASAVPKARDFLRKNNLN